MRLRSSPFGSARSACAAALPNAHPARSCPSGSDDALWPRSRFPPYPHGCRLPPSRAAPQPRRIVARLLAAGLSALGRSDLARTRTKGQGERSFGLSLPVWTSGRASLRSTHRAGAGRSRSTASAPTVRLLALCQRRRAVQTHAPCSPGRAVARSSSSLHGLDYRDSRRAIGAAAGERPDWSRRATAAARGNDQAATRQTLACATFGRIYRPFCTRGVRRGRRPPPSAPRRERMCCCWR